MGADQERQRRSSTADYHPHIGPITLPWKCKAVSLMAERNEWEEKADADAVHKERDQGGIHQDNGASPLIGWRIMHAQNASSCHLSKFFSHTLGLIKNK